MNFHALFAGTIAACLVTPTPTAAADTVNLGLRTLVVHNSAEDLQLARVVIGGHGAPYDAHLTSALPDLANPTWHSVVVMTCDANTLAKVRAYAKNFGSRLVCLHSPDTTTATADLGVGVSNYGGEQRVAFDTSPFGRAVADVMNVGQSWNLVASAHTPISYSITNSTSARPIIRYTNAASGPDGAGAVAAFVSDNNGHQEMHFGFKAWAHELCKQGGPCLVDMANKPMNHDYTKLAMALGNVWFQWVTRGVYLGQRRVVMQLHIDDYFAESQLHDNSKLRITYTDVQKAAEWAKATPQRHKLPEGSSVTMEMAYNGFAHTSVDLDARKPEDKGLRAATEDFLGDFNWVSHTWTHNHMDWLGSWQCKGNLAYTCPTPRERNRLEILYNKNLALGIPVPAQVENQPATMWYYNMSAVEGGKYMFYNKENLAKTRFSPSCLVTPEVSGLFPLGFTGATSGTVPRPGNQDVLVPMNENGIKTVVGDNSRYELVSKVSVHHGIQVSKANYGVDGPLIIPRAAVGISFAVADPALWVKWYNEKKSCDGDFGPLCKSTPYSYEEAMARNTDIGSFYLLQYRADAFMFHQANIHFTDFQGSSASLTTLWADSVLSDYMRYVNRLPITSPRMEDAGEYFRQRMARDACGLTGTVQVVKGVWQKLDLQGTGSCTAAVSVGRLAGIALTGATKETYGPDSTYRAVIEPGKRNSFDLAKIEVQEDMTGGITPSSARGGPMPQAGLSVVMVVVAVVSALVL